MLEKYEKNMEYSENELLTTIALSRLQEEKNTPGERINALINGEVKDRIPFQIIDNTSRLVGKDINDFFFNPAVRYQSLCAQIIRWGVPMTETASRINSYLVGETLGAKLNYYEGEAPSTKDYIIKTTEEFDNIVVPDLNPLVAKDIWLINKITDQFGDKLGLPCCFMYPPFSWVATYLCEANKLYQDIYDRPDFVHRMCRFATDLELAIIDKLTEKTECAFFMPGGFADLLSPQHYAEFNITYMSELINKNPDCIFYLPVPGRFDQLNELYTSVKEHKNIINMGSSIGSHTPIKNKKELMEFCDILNSLDRPYQMAVNQSSMRYSSPEEIINEVENLFKIGKKENMMIRTDTLDPLTPHENIDALVWAVKNFGRK